MRDKQSRDTGVDTRIGKPGGAAVAGRTTLVERAYGSGGGAPLPAGPRSRFEASQGDRFGDVRVHDDAASHVAAAELGANAFTVGSDIHFAAGQLRPDEPAGLRLLAHEVAHTVQQRGGTRGVQAKLAVSQAGDASELEADRFADHIVEGAPLPSLSLAPSSIQRQEATPAAEDEYYTQVPAIVEEFLAGYLQIEILVTIDGPEGSSTMSVFVDTPYWNNDYATYMSSQITAQERAGLRTPPQTYIDANTAHDGQPGQRTADLAEYDTKTENHGTKTNGTPVTVAKGSPEEIKTLVQNAVTKGVIAPPESAGLGPDELRSAWKAAIEQWMFLTGIGLDCNGFVYQALDRIEDQTGAVTPRASTGTKGIFDDLPDDSEVNDSRTGAAVPGFVKVGLVKSELELEPGDTMVLGDEHVRIVMRIDERDLVSKTIEFTTAESTYDGRTSETDPANGPRMHFWRYVAEEDTLYHRHDDDDATPWVDSHEDPEYRRHLVPPPAAPS